MSSEKSFGLFVLLIILIIPIYSSIFIVSEGEQAIIVEFGKPVKVITEAGPNFKIPFLQKTRFVDKRILNWDGAPNQIPTKDKKYIFVDTTSRWQIIDALKFIKTVQTLQGAKSRLNDIIDATTRDTISNNNLVETVRNSNAILDTIKEKKVEMNNNTKEDDTNEEIEVIGEVEKIEVGRERLSEMIAEKADKEAFDYGIKIIDVQLKRIAYETSVESKVYERMISERQRMAEKIRSIGEGEKAKIQGRLGHDLQEIESMAQRDAKIIEGEAEAKATAIYASVLSKDPKFYEFIKSMEVYRNSLDEKTELILSTNNKFLKFLK